MDSENFDFAVVGGGIAGLMTAYELSQTGASVVIVDAGYPRASAAGAGIISALPPWKYAADLTALIRESDSRLGSLVHEVDAAGGRDCQWRRPGMLVLPEAPPSSAAGPSVPVHWLAPLLAGARSGQYGIWMPEVGQIRAARFSEGITAVVKKRGVRFWRGAAVFETAAQKITQLSFTDGRKLSAGAYVLCAGARSGVLCPPPAPPVTPVRGQLLLYETPKPLLCIVLAERERLYLAPVENDFLVAGASYQHAEFDDRPSAAVQAELHKQAAALFPPLAGAMLLNSWSGLRPVLPEDRPVIGAHPEYGNLYLNTGHGRYGLSMAPAAARHILKIINNEAAHNPFAFREEWA